MSASKMIVSIIHPHFVSALKKLAPTSHEFSGIFVRLTYEKIVVFFWEYDIIIMSKGNTKVLRRYPSAFDGNLVSEDKAAVTVSR